MAKFEFLCQVVPGNSGFLVPFDSTQGLHGSSVCKALAANPAAGSLRMRWPRSVVKYSVECTGQNVTVDEQVLTGVAGTNADWTTQTAGGTFTVVAAAAPTLREFTPGLSDFRVLVTGGATAPTTLIIRVMAYETADRGS